ncbi:MAG: MFS transporter [Gammaproteobacteria bacterium]|nr:MFS transporter [Gammaproteobacteria bacterium]MDH5650934.1 MFS transporter [Gammaproteobacteria bacterium]
MQKRLNKEIISWALYDWGNSAFAVVMLTAIFPVYFKDSLSAGLDTTTGNFWWGLANSFSSIVIVLLAPVLGAIADAGGNRKKFLAVFAVLGILSTFALFFANQGEWVFGLTLFILGSVGFMGANIFYDSMIVLVAPSDRYDFVSALGYSLGYLGGGLVMVLDVLMFMSPEKFGFSNQTQAIKAGFISVAVWWGVFTLPLLMFVKERNSKQKISAGAALRNGLSQLANTFREIRKLKVVMLFLAAYWLYIDGVDTIVRMAGIYGKSLGFDNTDLIKAILITQFVGFPAAIAFGFIGERFGAKRGILIAIAVYIGVTIWAFRMEKVSEFYGLAIVVGLVQGGVQSLSRSFYARIIPANKTAEFFGFYNMLGKFAAVLGPLLMGVTGLLTNDIRVSILSVIVLFIGGACLLYFVDEEQGKRMARELE